MTATASRPGEAALWYGLLGAPAAWSLQSMVSYALVAVSCPSGDARAGLAAAVIATSVTAFAVAAGALAVAIRNGRAAPAAEEGGSVLARAVRHRVAFMGYAGIFTSAVFTIGTVFTAAGPFVLEC